MSLMLKGSWLCHVINRAWPSDIAFRVEVGFSIEYLMQVSAT